MAMPLSLLMQVSQEEVRLIRPWGGRRYATFASPWLASIMEGICRSTDRAGQVYSILLVLYSPAQMMW